MLSGAHQKGAGTGSELAGPRQFALGSPQSRAAARALLKAKSKGQFKGILVRFVSALGCDDANRKCTCPAPPSGTIALCRCFT